MLCFLQCKQLFSLWHLWLYNLWRTCTSYFVECQNISQVRFVFSLLYSGYTSLTGMSQKWYCVLLYFIRLYPNLTCPSTEDINLIIWLRKYVLNFSKVALFLCYFVGRCFLIKLSVYFFISMNLWILILFNELSSSTIFILMLKIAQIWSLS